MVTAHLLLQCSRMGNVTYLPLVYNSAGRRPDGEEWGSSSFSRGRELQRLA